MLTENIEKIIHEHMLEYARYVIKERALPDIRDGLKPAQRCILITMDRENASDFVKAQKIDGQVMAIHPHGSTYNVSVGMVQTDNKLTPLIIGKGSFGQHTSRDLQASAPRYTEVKLSEMAKESFEELKYNVVDLVPTYDDNDFIPEVLPFKFPMILHEYQIGIAVGMNCSIPSYNLIELNNAVIKYIDTGELDVLYPDFATGGLIEKNFNNVKRIYDTGEGSFKLRAKFEVKENIINIYEIPYTTNREAILESITNLVKNKKIVDIVNVKDLTGLDGMWIEITCKKNADMNRIINDLYQYTPLESYVITNFTVLVNDLPKKLGFKEIIDEWLNWRVECVRKKLEFKLRQINHELDVLDGLSLIRPDLPKCIQIILNSSEEDVEEKLGKEFGLYPHQVEYIANLKLKNFNIKFIEKKMARYNSLSKESVNLSNTIKLRGQILKIIKEELEEVNKKYGQPRRTQIEEFKKLEVMKEKDIFWHIAITKEGYVKKTKEKDKFKMKENDKVVKRMTLKNEDEILAFTKTAIYKFKVAEIAECKNDYGVYLPSIVSMPSVDGYGYLTDSTKFILIVYRNNKIGKIDAESFRTLWNRRKIDFKRKFKIFDSFSFEDEDMNFPISDGINSVVINTKYFKTYKSRHARGMNMPRRLFKYVK